MLFVYVFLLDNDDKGEVFSIKNKETRFTLNLNLVAQSKEV